MKILSIDVGIKNLAICLLEVTDSKLYKINNWEVINLCNDTIPKCSCYLSGKKSKNKCDKNAKYTKDGKNYCKTHAKKTEYIIPTTELYSSRLNKCKIAQLYEICAKYNVAIGIIATPEKVAESIADDLEVCGIKSILNFAPVLLKNKPGMQIRSVDLSQELQILSYYLERPSLKIAK